MDDLTIDEAARVAAAQGQFDAEVTYLDTATMGLPPRRSWEALQRVLSDWRAGTADASSYDLPLTQARELYAALVQTPVSTVAVGSQVSALVGLIAASLRPGCEVLTASGDFTSVLFPLLAQQARGVQVREVPLERLAESVTASTSLVAVSAVQSADGRVAQLADLRQACDSTGARSLLDLTQAAGWLPVNAAEFTYTVCGGYKWLLAPRGTAYLTVAAEAWEDLVPHSASWYAGADRWASIYGGPLRLAADARRFDVSPAWHSWVGAAPALQLLIEVGTAALHRHAVGLADAFCVGVGLEPRDSAIVTVEVDDRAAESMHAAQVVASVRAGRLRLAFHVSTTATDVDRAVDVLRSHVVVADRP